MLERGGPERLYDDWGLPPLRIGHDNKLCARHSTAKHEPEYSAMTQHMHGTEALFEHIKSCNQHAAVKTA